MTTSRGPRVGLVLGAGGIVGQAYHAGVLKALEHDLGWDARTADVIVGSSAGSVTGALLRLGVAADDLAAWAVDAPLRIRSRPVRTLLDEADRDLPPYEWRDLFGRWRLPGLRFLWRHLRPWRVPVPLLLAAMAPDGRVDLAARLQDIDGLTGDDWPDGLRVCVVRRRDGRRVVLGADGAPDVALGTGVAASCAIPGYFAPVEIEGEDHVDGGMHSPSNADVLVDEGLDLVVAVSPMSAAGGRSAGVDAGLRWSVHRRLEQEVARLRSEGTEIVRFEPSRRVLAAMGINAMAPDRSADVVREAFLDAGRHALRPHVARRLSPLAGRRPERSRG